jgi:glyoxylate/hydroxypyruvate reductase A
MPVLLFISQTEPADSWKRALERVVPGIEVRIWPEAGSRGSVDYVLCWKPPAGVFRGMNNLKAVFSLGAGVDHLSDQRALAEYVPVVRMVEPALTEGMTEYVIYQVLRFHRHMLDYDAQQSRTEWRVLSQVRPRDRRIGMMGLGVLGQDAAEKLRLLDFDVAGWSRSEKKIPGVQSFAGSETLDAADEGNHGDYRSAALEPVAEGRLRDQRRAGASSGRSGSAGRAELRACRRRRAGRLPHGAVAAGSPFLDPP